MTENKTLVNTSQELPRWIQTLAKRNELQRGNRERGRAFYVQTIVIFLATPAGSRLLTRRPAPARSLPRQAGDYGSSYCSSPLLLSGPRSATYQGTVAPQKT